VPVIDLADLPCGPAKMRRAGAEWDACRPLPDHEDHTPSFTANPEKNVWFCHGCLRGGDVIELARFAWGYEKREVVMAAADLLRREVLEKLERDRDSLLEHYARMVPTALDNLTSEERQQVYWMLRLRVLAFQDGALEVSGVFGDNFSLENQYRVFPWRRIRSSSPYRVR
jgi:hypothetical protein